MSHEFVVKLSYKIKYETKQPVPIDEVVEALDSLNTLLSSTSSVLSSMSKVDIVGHQLYVERIESGSLIEDIAVGLIFGNKEKMDEFLLWLHNTKMREVVVGLLIGGAITYGLGVLNNNNAVPSSNTGSLINNSPNSMIINFPEGVVDDEIKKTVNEEIAKRVKNKDAYARQTLNFFKPNRDEAGSSVSFGDGDSKAVIPAQTIQQVPTKYTPKKNNRFEDLSAVEVELRATDLDSLKSGWAGSIKDITSRLKIELDPTLDPSELYGKTKITADVTLERDYNAKDNQMVPKRIIIRAIH